MKDDAISIVNPEIDLHGKTQDRKAAALKAIVGAAPGIGSFLVEIVNEVIPNQRLERIALFAEVLDQRLSTIEEEVLHAKMKSEEFTDLLEDAFTQAARASTDERREYIASLLERSLTGDDLSHFEEKKLLALLGELNDAEILFLRFYSMEYQEQRRFEVTHRELLLPSNYVSGLTEDAARTREAFRSAYRNKLIELRLLEGQIKMKIITVNEGHQHQIPEYAYGGPTIDRYNITALGRMLLRYILRGNKHEPSTV